MNTPRAVDTLSRVAGDGRSERVGPPFTAARRARTRRAASIRVVSPSSSISETVPRSAPNASAASASTASATAVGRRGAREPRRERVQTIGHTRRPLGARARGNCLTMQPRVLDGDRGTPRELHGERQVRSEYRRPDSADTSVSAPTAVSPTTSGTIMRRPEPEPRAMREMLLVDRAGDEHPVRDVR